MNADERLTLEVLQRADRKKQLGQYFTDQRVGRLLAALAGAKSARTIIDPMVGSADLLRSCLSVGARPDRLVGVELDALALGRAQMALNSVAGVELVLGDAFSAGLPHEQFDLVITNPPYIRYQSSGVLDGIRVPTSKDVRAGLVRAITGRTGLSSDARQLWLDAARSYPGTSDVAVPSWILSAALVREGGMLAVVAPQTWLSRNYAHAVRELLHSAFDIEVIVEDGDAAWFADAQVRTQLVVARRRPVEMRPAGHPVVMARATSKLNTNGVLRGSLGSEEAVATALRDVTSDRPVTVTAGLEAYVSHGLSAAASGRGPQLAARVAAIFGPGRNVGTRTLESYGWRAGQGLGTGANDFFYVNVAGGTVHPAARWDIESIAIPNECLLPAVRRQNELAKKLGVDDSTLYSRVVNFRGWVTAPDLKRMGPGEVRVLPPAVGLWIAQVAGTAHSARDPTKLFPHLTAVATNGMTDDSGRPVRFWYQLPELAPRHRPTLFLGRVCGGQPVTYRNKSCVVIDTNFAGLWPVEPDAMPPEALLALLNSSWVWASLEASCTVLGGGALKIEATDLRRLAFPDLSTQAVERLTWLGRSAVEELSDQIVRAIDETVAEALGEDEASCVAELRTFAAQALQQRTRRKKPPGQFRSDG
jgi:hypothetical protein